MNQFKRSIESFLARLPMVRRRHISRSGDALFRAKPQWNRFAEDWYDSRQAGRSSLIDQRPWLTYPAIEFLEAIDWSKKRVFEWGGGGSTLFFLRLGATVVTIEHDRKWSQQVLQLAKSRGYGNLDLRLHEPEKVVEAATCSSFGSSNAHYRHLSFEAYVTSIDEFPDSSFDLVLIDGRSRCACLNHGISKVAEGGILVFDNADRKEYENAIESACSDVLSGWTQFDLSGPTPYLWGAEAKTLAWEKSICQPSDSLINAASPICKNGDSRRE
ncbi:MAG: class I SAM-dependent methyltransferase [Planctomycetaceae bacterium]|nr:class I SAM-dependent methyltransferase [Planctomycetaceae bacterium]